MHNFSYHKIGCDFDSFAIDIEFNVILFRFQSIKLGCCTRLGLNELHVQCLLLRRQALKGTKTNRKEPILR